MPISIAIVDDHHLVAEALSNLVQKFDNYEVLFVAENGRDFLNQLRAGVLPDIVLLDLNMPEMDGFETADQLRLLYPSIRILALSMTDREEDIMRMLRHGVRGYLLKGCRPAELRQAFEDVMTKGRYYSEFVTSQIIRSLNGPQNGLPYKLNSREQDFVKAACSELTYNEIADQMCVSPRTVDGYREAVFQKMGVRNRVGMAIEAIKQGLVKV